jgi:diguanylate cyclase (GGDEF)-like protein
MKALIVDDHEMFRMGLCALLGQMEQGYDLVEAGTLTEGLDYINDHSDIDLILVDFNLPDGNGLELVRVLKDTYLHCHVVLMSGHETQDLAAEAMVAGANGFLPKSYASKEMKNALQKVINGEFFMPEKLQKANSRDTASMVGSNLLSVGPNVLDAALDPIIIFENGPTKKLEYLNNAAVTNLGLSKDRIGTTFKIEEYVKTPAIIDFIEDESRSSLLENEVSTSAFNQEDRWISLSISKIDFLGTPSVMCNLHDITALKEREKELEDASNTDPLTGMLNRRGFYLKANTEMERAKRFSHPLSIAMCDLDHFKNLNDSYGHDFGDEVIRQFSQLCKGNFRAQDISSRFGGEEFVILLVEVSIDEAFEIFDRMRASWQKIADTINGSHCQSTVSIGVTSMLNDDPDLDVMIKRADELLYVCKEAGRNIVKSD